MKLKALAGILGSIFLVLFLASCGGDSGSSTTDEPTPTPAELIKKATDASSSKPTVSMKGNFSGAVNANITVDGKSEADTGGEKSIEFAFDATVPTNAEEGADTVGEFNVNDNISFVADGSEASYITIDGYKPLKVDNAALEEQAGDAGASAEAVNLDQYEELITGLSDTFSEGASVSEGTSVDGQVTWKMDVNLEDIDYRKALDQYADLVFDISKQQDTSSNPAVEKEVEQIQKEMKEGIKNISDEDLELVKEVLGNFEISVQFYQDSGLVASSHTGANIDKEVIDSIIAKVPDMGTSKPVVSDDTKLQFDLSYDLTYSDETYKPTVPSGAVDVESPEGKKELLKIVQAYLPQLAPFAAQADTAATS